MSIEWQQEVKTKNIQPPGIPEFEVAGQQTDSGVRDQAIKLVVSRSVWVGLLLISVLVFLSIDNPFDTHRNFAQFDTSSPDQFVNRISLSLHGAERVSEVPGFIFGAKPNKGFSFVVADLSIVNRAEAPFTLNIFAIRLETKDGKSYQTHLNTRNYRGRLSNKKLKPGDRVRGYLVFHVPSSAFLSGIEIRGSGGMLGRTSF